jgi:hypothetical protein
MHLREAVKCSRNEFVPPGQSASFAEEAARQVAGRDSGVCTEPHITQPPQSPDLAPSGRQGQWFLHRATHHPATLLSGPRSQWQAGTVVYALSHTSPSHRTLRTSLFPASRGHVSQPWRISNGMRRLNSRRFQQWQDGASVCVCVCVCVSARKGPTVKVVS